MSKLIEKQIRFIKIDKINGQDFIRSINTHFKNQPIIDKRYKILKEKEIILFPLLDNNEMINDLVKFLEDKYNIEIISRKGILDINFKHKNLIDALKDKIPEEFIEFIPKSYDSIGNLVIIEFDKFEDSVSQELLNIKKQIAEAITEINKNIVSVFEKKSKIKGTHRLREISHIYGENKTETVHKENNCSFKLDIKNCFFTPRLVYERNRVASSNFKENEIVIDLFAGVGPFSIQIAKLHKVKLYSFDINQEAYNYLKENIKLNKIIGDINPLHKDIGEMRDSEDSIRALLQNKADRIIMNLPEQSLKFIDVACILMKKSGGILHLYQFSEKPEPVKKAIKFLKIQLNKLNWEIGEVTTSKIVKAFSPKSDLIVIDAIIKRVNP
jgi:tRNA (guanine37-N1)-methyltransferase